MMNKDHNDLDKLAKQRLADLEYDFNPADWERLEKKLDRKVHLMPRLFWLKATEVSLMLLMVLSVYPFLMPKTKPQQPNTTASKHQPSLQAQAGLGSASNNAEELALGNRAAAMLNQAKTKEEVEQANAFAQGSGASTGKGKKENNKNNNNTQAGKRGFSGILGTGAKETRPSGLNTENEDKGSGSDLLATEQLGAGFNAATSEVEAAKVLGVEVLQAGKLAALWLPVVQPSFGLPLGHDPEPLQLQKNKIVRPFRPRLYFTGLAGAEALSKTHHGDAKMGYFVGAWLDANVRAKWSIAGGLQVHRRQYTMLQTEMLSDGEGREYSVRQESDTYVHLVQMPLSVRYNVLENKKWKVGVGVGLLGGFVLHRNTQGEQSTVNQQTGGQVEITTRMNNHAQDRGLFQGGQLGSNVFLAAGLQVSGERQLTDRYSLFIQPGFHYALTTLSPWKDRVNTFALTVGIKTNITK